MFDPLRIEPDTEGRLLHQTGGPDTRGASIPAPVIQGFGEGDNDYIIDDIDDNDNDNDSVVNVNINVDNVYDDDFIGTNDHDDGPEPDETAKGVVRVAIPVIASRPQGTMERGNKQRDSSRCSDALPVRPQSCDDGGDGHDDLGRARRRSQKTPS